MSKKPKTEPEEAKKPLEEEPVEEAPEETADESESPPRRKTRPRRSAKSLPR